MEVRTRIAPSPTGDPHVGTAYIALFNWAFARANKGKFLLRIEDTDLARSTKSSEEAIFSGLKWLGLDWDEGPDCGGECGPYRQSERVEIYAGYVDQLLEAGHAFRCFCSKDRLDQLRISQQKAGETTRYDGLCLSLSKEDVDQKLASGEASVVRMKVPETGECVFEDRLRGSISIGYDQIDMQVILKTDGMPTYHLAVVVDDHLMRITHVLRGEEWLNSVPKHKLLFEYFGWQMPELIHLPLLRNEDKSKLSKRKNPTSLNYYKDMGVLPEALLNFLGLMGWSMPDEREIFDIKEMIGALDLDRISTSGPVFDQAKLKWLNGQYLRKLDDSDYQQKFLRWLESSGGIERLLPLVKERAETFSELAPITNYLIGNRVELSLGDFNELRVELDLTKKILHHLLAILDAHVTWDKDSLFAICGALASSMDLKMRDFLSPVFVAISGKKVALPLFDSMVILGPDLSRARLRDALNVIGVYGKEQKKLEKAFNALTD